jgi:hypothetical protein
MTTTTKSILINVHVQVNHRTKIIRCIKQQLFTIEDNTPHHLIGNMYYDELTNLPIDIIKELSVSQFKIK